MSTSSSVRTFLEAKLAAVADIPAIAQEGVKYERKAGTPFVRSKLIPAETIHNSIGQSYVLELKGLMQFDVFYPPMRGMTAAEATVQSIIDAFAPATLLDNGEQLIIDAVWAETAREEPSWLQIPVMIRWRAFRLSD